MNETDNILSAQKSAKICEMWPRMGEGVQSPIAVLEYDYVASVITPLCMQ